MQNFDIPSISVAPAIITRAEEHDRAMAAHRRGVASQKIYKPGQNKIGFIGELMFGEWLYNQHIYDYEWSEPDLRAKGDEYDYLIGRNKIDVKTIESHKEYGSIYDQTVRLEEHQEAKDVDVYVFVLYRSDMEVVYLLGASTKSHFMQANSYRFVEKGTPLFPGSSFMAQGNHHAILVRDLVSMHRLAEKLREVI